MPRAPRIAGLADLPQLASLRHRDYRYTWFAGMTSGAAMWTAIVASSWLVFSESSTSAWVGIVTFGSMIPILLVSPIGGLIGDMLDRRNVTIVTFVLNGVIVGVLAALAITGVVQPWHVALIALVGGVVRAIQMPAMAALVPNLVPKDDLLNALVLQGATRHGARFFGLGVAVPLLAIEGLGINSVLVLSAALQLLGALAMSRVRTASTGRTEPEHGLMRSVVDGVVYIYTNHIIALFVVLVAFHCALVMSFESIMPSFSKNSLGATDPSVFNYLMMGFGAGSLLGMMAIAGVRSERQKGRLLMITGIGSGLSPVLLALSGSMLPAVVFAASMGATQSTFMALTNTYVQMLAPDHLRARISSLYAMHAGGIMAFANLGYAFMADAFSAPPILAVTGVVFIAVIASLSAGQPIMRQVYRTGQVAI